MFLLGAHDDPFHHVRDSNALVGPFGFELPLPSIGGFQLTKFMVLEVIAALLTFLIFRGLARHVQSGRPTQGRFWNFWEAIALFVRDEVVRPTIGDEHHDDHGHEHEHDHGHGHDKHGHHHEKPLSGHHSDKFLPFIWSCFFFILFCNLLGAIPMLGSPTGATSLTLVLAVSVFVYNVYQGSVAQGGLVTFILNQCPNLGLSGPMRVIIGSGLWCIEIIGFFIKHGVLAIRLFANIMGGHTVIGVILGFIALDSIQGALLPAVIFGSVVGQVVIGLLELFVAFLQAYVFAYLATIFLSSSLHAH